MRTHTETTHAGKGNRFENRGRKAVLATAGTLLAAAGAVAGLGVTQADAETPSPEIRTTAAVNVRYEPSLNARVTGVTDKGEQYPAACTVLGDAVDGIRTWYALPGEGNEYISGRYVQEVTPVPRCDDVQD